MKRKSLRLEAEGLLARAKTLKEEALDRLEEVQELDVEVEVKQYEVGEMQKIIYKVIK